MEREQKNLKVFGYGLAIILCYIVFHVQRAHGWHPFLNVLLMCSLILVFVTLFTYESLRLLYKGWMKVAHFIGGTITGIILTVMFYCVFGVIGLILRLIGKDLLDQKIDPSANSYWLTKEQIPYNKDYYLRQF